MARKSFCLISWGGLQWPNTCYRLQFVFSAMLCLVLFLPCEGKDQIDVIQNRLLYDACDNFRDFDGLVETEVNLPGYLELKNACSQSTSLCFPSTLIGLGTYFDRLQSEKKYLESDNFSSCNGSPSLNVNQLSYSLESLSSPYVVISPTLLDWGTNTLFTLSLIHLTVGNMHNSSVLHVFELFSSNEQFYAYNFEKLSLAPGEAGSITFVFVPKRVGLALAHVVLQTNFGGFVINAKGLAIEPPYKIEPFAGFEPLLDGRLFWNLSLHNTFDDILYVEEITARISFESESTHRTHLTCSVESSQISFGQFGSFCKTGEIEVSWMEIRPHKNWEVTPLNTEIIMEMNLWPPVKGKISGVICIKLKNYTRHKIETIIVPIEAEVDSKATYNSLTGSVSIFFEPLVPWDEKGFVCTLSVRNSAPYLLSVVSIRESLEVFKVRYMEGLLLYPDTITHVALIGYNIPDVTKVPWLSPNCKLYLSTNDSISPEIEITCQDLVQTCFRNGDGTGFLEPESSFVGLKSQEQKLTNSRTGSLGRIVEASLSLELKFLELLEADQLILRNWRSQGTMSNLSVLKEQELLFPVVQIGSYFAKWIMVHNPSPNPVVMQLVLNSGAIVDHCKFSNDQFKIFSLETHDGFSIPETTTAEALIPPFESTQIGPILFHPLKLCTWKSSILIRNNLSGVEWLSLRASGGSHMLLLFEGTKPVKKIEFNFGMPTIHNSTLETRSKSCVHQLYKELYAKNAGELPLEVKKLEVSGSDCGSNGFMIHNCKGFFLEPGESTRLLISYRADFSAELVQRELKLAMDTGFLVIPMRASIPINSIDLCKYSLLWTVKWKLLVLIITAFVVCLVFFFLLHPITSGDGDYSVKSGKTIAIKRAENPPRTHRNTKNIRPVKKNHKLEEGLVVDKYPCCGHTVHENSQRVKEKKELDHHKKPTMQSPPLTKIPIGAIDNSETSEARDSLQSSNLTVKVVKERGRRRKKRANGGGLASKFEVSSSQSGNSTPSSPHSPYTFNSSFSSFGAVSEKNHDKKPDFSFSAEPQRNNKRHVLLSSATFPSSTSNFLASSSPIAPCARAPGSNLSKEKGMKTEEDINETFGKEYTYDIWGNHFCGHLMIGKSAELSSKLKACDASEGDSQSFFIRDPQSLMMMSSAQPESSELRTLVHERNQSIKVVHTKFLFLEYFVRVRTREDIVLSDKRKQQTS